MNPRPGRSFPILTLQVRYDQDVVLARQRARQVAALLGFSPQAQTRIATAVSETARNALAHAGGGRVEFFLEGKAALQTFWVRVSGGRPGVGNLEGAREGGVSPENGLALGLAGARRLMPRFHAETSPELGTSLFLGMDLPFEKMPLSPQDLNRVAEQLARREPGNPLEEVQHQNQELLRTLEDLNRRQEELFALNQELEDTNRGVVALYSELEEKAGQIRRADDLKSRFLSDMSHEFRTPLNSILSLSRLLLDRADGDLTEEQEKQVSFIRRAAGDLSSLVDDLLDLAKIEAGRITVRPGEFQVEELFATLRGMLRPLLAGRSLELVFEDPSGIPPMNTDQGKVAQILRNLVSNSLKFTERGEVRVAAALDASQGAAVFTVSDTGIGIAPQDRERIFQEFGQVEGPLQRRSGGTGLGLPISRKLAQLLGGDLVLAESRPGQGSAFRATIPLAWKEPQEVLAETGKLPDWDETRFSILVVEDDPSAVLLYEKYLKGAGFRVIPARNTRVARQILKKGRPFAVILDILIPGDDTWGFLAEMKEKEATREIPILVLTVVEDRERSMALGADDYAVKPVERKWLLKKLRQLSLQAPLEKILVIDDDEISRYLIKSLLADTRYSVILAEDGEEGIRRAREEKPQAVFLDLVMPGLSGFEVLDRLKGDPLTREIPVIVVTSKVLAPEEREKLAGEALAVLSKKTESRREAAEQVRQALAAARERGEKKDEHGEEKKPG